MKPYIRQSTKSDADVLAPSLRTLDLKEIELSSGLPPRDALVHAMSVSDEPKSIVLGADVIGMFGVAPHPESGGVPWFLSSGAVAQHKLTLLKEAKCWVTESVEKYGKLQNYCLAEHEESLQFIELLNFTLNRVILSKGEHWVEFSQEAHNV